MKNTYLYIKTFAAAALLTLGLTACSDDDYKLQSEGTIPSGPLKVEFADGALMDVECNITGKVAPLFASSAVYDMYTNAKSWTVEADYSESIGQDWIYIFPSKGNLDGRFSLTVSTNGTDGDPRTAVVRVKSGDGTIMQEISVTQDPTTPSLKITGGSLYKDISADGATANVLVNANVKWFAQPEGDASEWVSIGETSQQKLELIIDPNDTSEERTGVVNVYRTIDPTLFKSVTLIQKGLE